MIASWLLIERIFFFGVLWLDQEEEVTTGIVGISHSEHV